MKQHVLIADDEPDVLDLLSAHVTGAGLGVHRAEDGYTALSLIRSQLPALAVLDLMMPGLTGLEICRAIRSEAATAHIPVILLTARTTQVDRIVAFELGVDDYVTKPFSPRELVLRVRSILRRFAARPSERAPVRAGEIHVDFDRHETTVSGRPVDLTAIEFKLLTALLERSSRVCSRNDLLSAVWGFEHEVDSRTVDTHLRRLREKLGPAGSQIRTVRGFGYRIDEA